MSYLQQSYLEQRRAFIEAGRPLKEKKRTPIKRISDKLAAKRAEAKLAADGETELQKWFLSRRKEMSGKCACGCGRNSPKFDDKHFRAGICHVFPQAKFGSVKCHRMNWVERSFWDGCHGNMDNRSIELWPKFADWEKIKEIFHELAPLLTDEERATKFYNHLEKLIYENQLNQSIK